MFFAILSAISAALVAILGKLGISEIDSTLATTVRAFIMAFFLGGVSLMLGKFKFMSTISNRAFTFIALSGIAGAMSWLFYFLALKKGPVTGVVALDRLSVVFALIFAVAFLSEGFTWKNGIGAVLVSLGAIMMSLK